MSKPSGHILTIMSANLQYGGLFDADGRADPDRLKIMAGHVRDIKPDILTTQEGLDWGQKPWLVADAEHAFGGHLRALVAPSGTGAHTGTFFDTRVFRWLNFETKYSPDTHHGFGVACLQHRVIPKFKLNIVSGHLNPSAAEAAAIEAKLIAWRLLRNDGDPFCVLCGDINHFPPGDPEPPWHEVRPFNRSSRTLQTPDGLRGNPVVGLALQRADLFDVAAWLADRDSDPSLRAATGRGKVRVDQFHVTAALLPAIVKYERIETIASDHNIIVMTLDLSKI